jgi:hypothetical protein
VRLLRASSPFAVAAVALFFLLGALALGRWPGLQPKEQEPTLEVYPPPYLPTREMPIDYALGPDGNGNVPGAVGTAAVAVNATAAGTPARATATLGRPTLIKLAEPTPVYEDGSATAKSGWHAVRDATFGYTVHYPPNWWTRAANDTRYFYPWTMGGTRSAPYWIELSVTPNSRGLTAQTANEPVCGGACEQVEANGTSLSWLRRDYMDEDTYHDEGYLFDAEHIYRLRLNVPYQALPELGGFQERVAESQGVFGLMSGRLAPLGEGGADDPAFGGMLFLNGTDLWLTNVDRGGAMRVTISAGVRRFAQSPDLSRVAYTSSDNDNDVWGTSLYLTRISANGPEAPTLLARGMELHDVAWYSDRTLVALARNAGGQLGLFKLTVPDPRYSQDAAIQEPVLLTALDERFAGARALKVSPDRQLITFLAPVGQNQGTDLYAVRPDGSGLSLLVGHEEPLSPLMGTQRALAPESQALKDYVWADGRLEQGGYAATILFTCGNAYSPNWYLGGYLYSTSSIGRGPALDPAQLSRSDAERMQVIHVAYSSAGKVALTGYVNDSNDRADQLVGLWTADMVRGAIVNPRRMPVPDSPHGVTDLQWTPDGKALVYRETVPYSPSVRSARYDGVSGFRMVRLDVGTGQTQVLFQSEGRQP